MTTTPQQGRTPGAIRRRASALSGVLAVLAAVLLGGVTGTAASVGTAAPARAASTPIGVDVSRYQHPNGAAIDWTKVAGAGYSFAFIKATEGTSVTNPYYDDDVAAARSAGLYRGAYHFARPSTDSGSAASQAASFASSIGDQSGAGTLAPVLDLEQDGGLTTAQLVAWTKSFLTTLQSRTGRTPVLYTYPSFWSSSMGSSTAFEKYPLWIANYGVSSPNHNGWSDWTFWQNSSTGSVPGISGDVDVNRFHGSDSELAALAAGEPKQAPPVTSSAPARYTPLAPTRVVDTRTGVGAPQGPVVSSVTVQLPTSVPDDAAGVVLNVSSVAPSAAGYLRVAPAGASPTATALNMAKGRATTALVTSATDDERQVTFWVYGARTQLVVDLVGFYDSGTGTAGRWAPVTPTRFVDTRDGTGVSKGTRDGALTITLPDSVPADARGVVLNVSVVDPVRTGYLQVSAAGAASASTAMNYAATDDRTALVLTRSAGHQVTLTLNGGPAHVVVDLVGYYGEATGSASYVGVTPSRFLDTRYGTGASGRVRTITLTLPDGVPTSASGAVLNLSVVGPDGAGYVRAAAAGTTATTTALNFSPDESQTGLVVTPVDDQRRVTLTVFGAGTDLVADLVGYHA